MIDLCYSLQSAGDVGENRHAQSVMRELGISYARAEAHSIYDAWFFFDCVNVPEILPSYLTVRKSAMNTPAKPPHILVNKTIASIMVNKDKDALAFTTSDGDTYLAVCEGDCCSMTWVENIEFPARAFPALVFSVEELELEHMDETDEHAQLIQHYGYKIATDRGDLIIDFRNESNGYYGGSMTWSDKPVGFAEATRYTWTDAHKVYGDGKVVFAPKPQPEPVPQPVAGELLPKEGKPSRFDLSNPEPFADTIIPEDGAWVPPDQPRAVDYNADGWFDTDGGPMPVAPRTFVHVRFRDGSAFEHPSFAREWRWEYQFDKTDIMQYKIVDYVLRQDEPT